MIADERHCLTELSSHSGWRAEHECRQLRLNLGLRLNCGKESSGAGRDQLQGRATACDNSLHSTCGQATN